MVNLENKKPGAEFYTAWVSFSIVSGIAAFIIYLVIAKTYNAVAGDWIVVDGVTHGPSLACCTDICSMFSFADIFHTWDGGFSRRRSACRSRPC